MSESNGEAEKSGTPAANGTEAETAAPELSPLEAAVAERDKLKDQLLRTAADFDNFRKRSRKDIEEAMRRGREDAVRELLPVADNLERALAVAPATATPDALLDGVKMVLKLLHDALERLNVTRIATTGERFDPALHEAIQQVETTEHPMGTIVAELVPGYKTGERLLRAAMVAVARPPAAKSEAS